MARLILEQTHDGRVTGEPVRDEVCPLCGENHIALWTVRRVLADTFGHFAVYRLNGVAVPVDPTLPHTVARPPRDARRLSVEDAHAYWRSDGYSVTG